MVYLAPGDTEEPALQWARGGGKGQRERLPTGPEPGVWQEASVAQHSLLVSFVEVRLPQGLHEEGILLFAHELRQRMGQGAPVALLTQGVQQDPCQMLGRHLEKRGQLRSRLPRREAHHPTPRSPCAPPCLQH